jgi:hypothetical protein
MKNEFQTIETNDLDNVSGGNRGQAVRKAAGWAWRNVIAPMGGGAVYEWASQRLGGGGGQQPQQPQQPAQQPGQ